MLNVGFHKERRREYYVTYDELCTYFEDVKSSCSLVRCIPWILGTGVSLIRAFRWTVLQISLSVNLYMI